MMKINFNFNWKKTICILLYNKNYTQYLLSYYHCSYKLMYVSHSSMLDVCNCAAVWILTGFLILLHFNKTDAC